MKILRPLATALLFSLTACTADSIEPDAVESSDAELRSLTFFQRSPMTGRRLETFRSVVHEGGTGHVWVQNQGTVAGLEWSSTSTSTSMTIPRGALAFLGRRGARDLKVTTDLEGALDTIGLYESSPDGDTANERAKMLDALRDIARTRGVTVFTATLHDAPDMYWENALVVVDEENRQVVVATGGFGT
jgi:hypothetical protein